MADDKKTIFDLIDKFGGYDGPFDSDWDNIDFKNNPIIESKIIEMNVYPYYSGINLPLFNLKTTNIVSSDSNNVIVSVKVMVILSSKANDVKIALNKNSAVTATKSTSSSLQYEANFNVKVSKSLVRIDKYSSQKFTFTATVTDYISKNVSDTRIIKVEIDTNGKVGESKISEGGNWFVEHKSGEYVWFDEKTKRNGYTRVGNYKVLYNRDKNFLSIYAGENSTFIETINMTTNSEGKYKSDEAAKFAIIAAESGGSYTHSTDDPTVTPLIIGGCLENRLRLFSLGITQYATGNSIQEIKGFQADAYKSYKDFQYGNKERFGLGESNYEKKNMNIGLSTVYTAVLGSIRNLNEFYSVPQGKVKQFEQMLYYAHKRKDGKKNTVNGDFDVAIPEGTSGKFDYVRGNSKYIDKLKPEK